MKIFPSILLLYLVTFLSPFTLSAQDVYFSVNQVGFHPEDIKKGVIFSKEKITGKIDLIRIQDSLSILKIKPEPLLPGKWGDFNYYEVDFSEISQEDVFFSSTGQVKPIRKNLKSAQKLTLGSRRSYWNL